MLGTPLNLCALPLVNSSGHGSELGGERFALFKVLAQLGRRQVRAHLQGQASPTPRGDGG